MVSGIRENLPELIALCARRGVLRLSVFGSAVRAEFEPDRSDIDLLVEFKPMTAAEHAEAYLGLIEEAEAMLGCAVDLLELHAIRNPYVLRQVEAEHEVLYDAA